MTNTAWPSGTLQSFYDDYISNRSYAFRYASIIDSHNDILKKLELKHEINQHFAGLQMYFDQLTMMEYNDRPQLPFIGFVSQLGGALNLWAGITVVIVIELIEIIYEIIMKQYKRPSNQKYSDDENEGEKLEVLVENSDDKKGSDWV